MFVRVCVCVTLLYALCIQFNCSNFFSFVLLTIFRKYTFFFRLSISKCTKRALWCNAFTSTCVVCTVLETPIATTTTTTATQTEKHIKRSLAKKRSENKAYWQYFRIIYSLCVNVLYVFVPFNLETVQHRAHNAINCLVRALLFRSLLPCVCVCLII